MRHYGGNFSTLKLLWHSRYLHVKSPLVACQCQRAVLSPTAANRHPISFWTFTK